VVLVGQVGKVRLRLYFVYMMTRRSARAPVALQLDINPVGHQLHQYIVYIENFQCVYPVNKLFFFARKSSLNI